MMTAESWTDAWLAARTARRASEGKHREYHREGLASRAMRSAENTVRAMRMTRKLRKAER